MFDGFLNVFKSKGYFLEDALTILKETLLMFDGYLKK